MLRPALFNGWLSGIGLVFAAALARAEEAPKASAPVPPPGPDASDCIVLDDFSETSENAFPKNWNSRYEHNQKEAEEKRLWKVVKDGERKVLHGVYGSHTITIVRKIEKWDLKTHPFFQWDWKAVQLPKGGDESSGGKNDSAASVYLVWEESWPMKGSFLRFAWSSTLPVDKVISKRLGYEKIFIKESGTAALNTWKTVKVNAAELARKELKKKGDKSAALIALNTDADGTKSSAEAYYANFKACRR